MKFYCSTEYLHFTITYALKARLVRVCMDSC